ncbi:MAG: peptidoglycan-binding protein [Actinomycetia bacterium]|nr:peptidoglycan-binding protein [Actinomycetes bacterium]
MDTDTLIAAMPGLGRARANECLGPMEAAMREFGITNLMRIRMALAQFGHESASLRYFEEIASGAAYEGRRDLGNTQKGDGVRYKGRGPIQITGRYNYTQAGTALNLALVSQPSLAAQPRHAFRVSSWWWREHGLNGISDTGDILAATRRINGGTRGLADRTARYNKAKALGNRVLLSGAAQPQAAAVATAAAPPMHVDSFSRRRNSRHADVRTWQTRMKARGWRISVDQVFGPASEKVCLAFQREKGLKADGIVGPKTWGAAWQAQVT